VTPSGDRDCASQEGRRRDQLALLPWRQQAGERIGSFVEGKDALGAGRDHALLDEPQHATLLRGRSRLTA